MEPGDGSIGPTDTHTMRGPDGLYYDPSKIESYFIEKSKYLPLNQMLKEMYSGTLVKDLAYGVNPLLALLK